MQVVKITFKTDKGKYELFTTDKSIKSILADDLFTTSNVEAKTGKIVNHGERIEKALGLDFKNEDEKGSHDE